MYGQGSRGWTYKMRNEEFQEEDMWGVYKARTDSDSSRFISSSSFKESSSYVSKRLPSATKMIPMATKTPQEPKMIPNSAPVNIPDWSKIYGTNFKNSDSDGDRNGGGGRSSWESGGDEEEDDDEEGNMIPPHEWIARRLARSQISSFSVCEGAGRTLKGRDLSRVRNAVLIKTGFLESQ